MIQDLHSHTYYSDCGKDEPRVIIERAVEGGITHFGITDHNYGIGERKKQYFEEISQLKEEYKGRITLFCGIEIATCNDFRAPLPDEDLSYFDYCLLEHIDNDNTVAADLFEFAKNLGCPVGIAHTDLFEYCRIKGFDPLEFLTKLAENNIFWEMNVNYDSIHGYREHSYVKEFYENSEMLKIVKQSAIKISVGFDGHKVEDYQPQRVAEMNAFLEKEGISRFVPNIQ